MSTHKPKIPKNSHSRKIICMVLAAVFIMAILSVNCYAATDMWTKATEIMKDVYGKVVGISTIAAVVTASVALLLMNFSKNGKTVDESRRTPYTHVYYTVVYVGNDYITEDVFGLTEDPKALAADFADSLSLYLDGGDADGTTD